MPRVIASPFRIEIVVVRRVVDRVAVVRTELVASVDVEKTQSLPEAETQSMILGCSRGLQLIDYAAVGLWTTGCDLLVRRVPREKRRTFGKRRVEVTLPIPM